MKKFVFYSETHVDLMIYLKDENISCLEKTSGKRGKVDFP